MMPYTSPNDYVEIGPNVWFRRSFVAGFWPCPSSCNGTLVLIVGMGVIHVDEHPHQVSVNLGLAKSPPHYDVLTGEEKGRGTTDLG